MLTCQQCRAEIETAQRPDSLTARAAEHLSACAACRAAQAERLSLHRLLSELEPVAAPPDFEFRLRARMQARQTVGGPFGFSLFAPRAVGLALAVSLALTFAVLLRLRPQPSQPGGDPGTRQSTAQVAPPAVAPVRPMPSEVVSAPPQVAVNVGATVSGPVKARRHLAATARTESARSNSRPALAPAQEVADLGVRGTSVVTAGGAGEQVASLPPIPVPVAGSAQPLKVLLKDTQGTARLVSIEAVSFGSRDLLAGRAQMTPVKATSDQGVW